MIAASQGVAVDGKRGPEMHLASGRRFFLLAPDPGAIDIRDIAAALSRQCRYTGHLRPEIPLYSVAQHCVLVSDLVPESLKYEALLHDAAEAYTGDLARPLKLAMRALSDGPMVHDAITEKIEKVIARVFGVPNPLTPEVKRADILAAAIEKKFVLGKHKALFSGLPDVPPWFKRLRAWSQREAERRFLERYEELARHPTQSSSRRIPLHYGPLKSSSLGVAK